MSDHVLPEVSLFMQNRLESWNEKMDRIGAVQVKRLVGVVLG